MKTAHGGIHARRAADAASFQLTDARLQHGVNLLTVRGELDIATVPALRERLTTLIDAGARRLVVNLLDVSFMDSTALAAFIHAKAQLGNHGRMTLVIAADSYARLILEVAGLDRVFDVVATVEAATRPATR
jgi:anti-sigma B factor antagonist